MNQTKPLMILKKYRSILIAAVIVEAVSFLVSLTDSIIAGSIIGSDAFAAIGLMTPFFSIATFFAAVINSGTVLYYSDETGAFHKQRANEYFSQGVVMAVATGLIFTVLLLLLKKVIIGVLDVPEEMYQYLTDYYDIIAFYFLFVPISCVLDNIVVADGGERLSAVSNVIQIVGNVILSLFLSRSMGVKGIAAATVTCKLIFVIIICFWFLNKKCNLRFVRGMHFKDCVRMCRRGVVRALTFAMSAVMTFILNAYVLMYFDEDILSVLIVAEKIIDLSTLFLGLAMALQPMIGTLKGERNTKAERMLLRRASNDMMLAGVAISLVLVWNAKRVVWVFGIREELLVKEAVFAVYITSATLIFTALLVFFFIYFFLEGRNKLSLFTCFFKDFATPLGLAVFLTVLLKTPEALWYGISGAAVLSLILCMIVILIRYGKDRFPFLLSKDSDDNTYIYAFELNEKNAADLSVTVMDILAQRGFTNRLQVKVGGCIEDMLIMIQEKNEGSKNPILVECNLIIDGEEVRMILRDSGVIFDITDEDARPGSFRQYIVANLITAIEIKTYLVTTGYNRNVFVFAEPK